MNNQQPKIKNEAKLLDIFCDKDGCRKELTAPYFNPEYNEVWSTDGRALICIRPELLSKEYTALQKSFQATSGEALETFTLQSLKEALASCPQVEEEIVVQPAVECKDCEGYGEVEWEYTDNDGYVHSKDFECPICHGTGYSQDKITKKTGKMIPDYNAFVKIGDFYFIATLACKLKVAMERLDVVQTSLSNTSRYACAFFLKEGVRVILVAYSKKQIDDDDVIVAVKLEPSK